MMDFKVEHIFLSFCFFLFQHDDNKFYATATLPSLEKENTFHKAIVTTKR